MKASSAKVSAIVAEPALARTVENPQTFMWPLITTKGTIQRPPRRSTTPVENRYGALTDDDAHDDDESEVVKALAQLTPDISFGKPKKSPRGMSMAKIASIARRVNSGKMRLPDLDLDNDAQYECVWALVDSGAGVNCAKEGQFSSAEDVEAPPVMPTTANGEHMPNSGAMRVTTQSKEGIVTTRTFYKAPVKMPILAVAELTQEGPQGSTTGFRKSDGFIETNHDKKKQHFVKRQCAGT